MTDSDKLDRILASVANIEKRLATLTVKTAAKASKVEPASDSDLDSQYGDPVVKKDPPRWKGQSFAGCKFSECTPEYLDDMASLLMWKVGKNEEEEAAAKAKGDEEGAKKANKYAFYARLDAGRAAGWAQRIRDGWHTPAQPAAPVGEADNSDIPF